MKNKQGFSLIEILVALALVGLVYTIAITGQSSPRASLDDVTEQIERYVRFASDEAALRNTIMRLHFKLDENPQTFFLEVGPESALAMPEERVKDTSKMTKEEKEEYEKSVSDFNKNFSKLKDFEDSEQEVPDNIRIIGVSTSDLDYLTIDSDAYIYIYPTGEKDNGLIIVSSDTEMIALEINPYTFEFNRSYHTMGPPNEEELEDRQIDLAKEIYANWPKAK
ncbi:MAG: hypothetical protein A2504_07735 [Bdellovibrionales bacterium RIFOXYD12_FULL_39_22]|nr:MAG: hypothetical protein A2385_11060 [Bdellovibrionales bacterium RIFOXYB1_FULL_39_21]OFZ41279.1 MAG: hypothetical protein A2485_00625 [Bdellovibrionales bacterium RIFOXYC12_FULL_39_17]OFZ45071.1 MAG: hypothetical protein A2404_11355 [Bdellovibrionales bacterium RIFOXYC1_FULL_39_130]OFZ70781.1 MAG: hypothetical protein A2451_02405 [Bdellovibrionales bacterium RIFOXYC2_FULL_39_8]OFZ74455.1 MAG: hypothetical protein A2560_11390 [Bdellovibrionales bacterium RIFOXYD1_FULL_39_84]OFZ92467.1 MAG: